MKRLALLFMVLIFAGCATTSQTAFEEALPRINIETKSGIGDLFFTYEYVERPNPLLLLAPSNPPFKYNLTVTALNDKDISLEYAEYHYVSYPGRSGWAIKPGFNKTFTYALADKIIRFKGYEFEITGLDKGQLTYKRVK